MEEEGKNFGVCSCCPRAIEEEGQDCTCRVAKVIVSDIDNKEYTVYDPAVCSDFNCDWCY